MHCHWQFCMHFCKVTGQGLNSNSKFETDIDLESGKYVVDAKSILGILSLNLSYPLDVVVHDEKLVGNVFESLQAFRA